MSTTLPPLESISPENHGPAVIAAAYVLIVVTILFTAIRLGTTYSLKRGYGYDDAFLVFAVIFGFSETIVLGRAAGSGLGRFERDLNSSQIDEYYKFSYASQLLAIAAMACAKMSVVMLMRRLSSRKSYMDRVYQAATLFIAVWTVFSLLALALQCGTRRPWVYTPERCSNKGAVWYPIIILNLLSDLVLSFLFAPVLWKLNMAKFQRGIVIGLFGMRILVSIAAIAQLAVLAPALRAADQTRANTVPAILASLVMNLSILAAAAPSLHRFLGELQTNRLGVTLHETHYELSHGSRGYGNKSKSSFWKPSLKSNGKGTVNSTQLSRTKENGHIVSENVESQMESQHRFRPDLVGKSQVNVEHDPSNRAETGSRTSDGSEKMIIRQTVAWDVQYDEEDNLRDKEDVNISTHE